MKFLAKALIAILVLPSVWLTGCPSQNQYAALAQIIVTTSASVATLEAPNNPALAAQINKDGAALITAIQNWKPGTPAQNVIQVIQLVEDDLNLIPAIGPYAPLIQLALGTANSLIILFEPNATPALTAHAHVTIQLAAAPKTAKDYKKQWNALVKSDPTLAPLAVK